MPIRRRPPGARAPLRVVSAQCQTHPSGSVWPASIPLHAARWFYSTPLENGIGVGYI